MQELINRPRRLRNSKVLRDLVAEARLDSKMLVQPHFVVPGSGVSEPIGAMPGIDHQSVDKLVETVGRDLDLGIRSALLFGVPDESDKSLVNFDPDRARKAAEAFGELARTNQVLVFTCHPAMAELFTTVDPEAKEIDISQFTRSGNGNRHPLQV